MKAKNALDMETRISGDFDNVSDEGSIASLDTIGSTSSTAIDLPPEWEVALADDKGRLYYIDNDKQATNWCPPIKSWRCCFGLPFGWEVAIDDRHFLYYINHQSAATTYKHPNYENKQFEALHQALQAKRRKVVIKRHPHDGFGFVAGSEKPVIIRSVVAGSPADGQLSANDQLFTINGQMAYNLPQPQVISMIRSCTDFLEMEVIATEDIQDVRNQGTLKSALMSRATRERRKSCPVSVRFEEKPEVVSLSAPSVLSINIIKQMIPNVLKIYLKNGQTKSFQYNTETTVKEIFDSLMERLQIKQSEYFALTLIGPYPNQSTFLQPEDRVTQIESVCACLQGEGGHSSHYFVRTYFVNGSHGMNFIPNDAFELLGQDSAAFDYWYLQTCDSVVKGHFGSELKFDTVVRLAALQIHVAMTSENEDTKFSLKDVSKEYGGLDDFLPIGIVNDFKKKDIKKALMAQLKSLSRISLPGQRLTPLQAKLHYLKIASQSPAFGGRILSAHIVNDRTGSDSSFDATLDTSDVLISPTEGICTLYSETGNLLQHLVDIPRITGMVVTSHLMNKNLLKIFVKDTKAISFILSPQDAEDMAFIISRYHRIQVERASDLPFYNLSQTVPRYKAPDDSKAPKYDGEHHVVPSTWSYIEDVVPTLWLSNSSIGDQNPIRSIAIEADFTCGPPNYNSQASYDRSSFVPFRQRPAVDTLIRELSIRDKKRNNRNTKKVAVTTLPRFAKKVSSPGQFDTTHFGQGSALVEEEDSNPDSSNPESSESGAVNETRHVITCSMSSDEESSDEEMSELARKINRTGTVAKFLKNKRNNRDNSSADYASDETLSLDQNDEEDSGWRTDTSSTTGSIGRSNPWGTFSEEDSSEKDSLKQAPDADSLFSHEEVTLNPTELNSARKLHDMKEFSTVHNAQTTQQNLTVSSGEEEHLGVTLMKTNSFSKYLVNKLPSNADTERSLLDELMSDSDERPSPSHRPLSVESDEVFAGSEQIGKGNSADRHIGSELKNEYSVSNQRDESCTQLPQPSSVKVKLNSPTARTGSKSPDSDISSNSSIVFEVHEDDENIEINGETQDIDDRPKSVNLTDLNIYIPSPPKEPTRALSPSDLVIPSPPMEFADNQEASFSYQFIGVEERDSSTESSDNSVMSSSSSSSDVIEFMGDKVNTSDATENCSTADKSCSLNIEESNDEDVIEFMKPEDNYNVRLYEEASQDPIHNHVSDRTCPSEQNDCNKDRPLVASPVAKLPPLQKSTSFNEKDKAHYEKLLNYPLNSVLKYENSRRQSEPDIPSLALPRSPGLDLKRERILSPLFFSVENGPFSPQTYHTRSHSDTGAKSFHFESPPRRDKMPGENQRLTLPSTPLAIRRNQYDAICSTEITSKSSSLPSKFSYDEFSDYLDACKTTIAKSLQLEDELDSLISRNKRLNRLSFESEDAERDSYVDVMRNCAKSLSNRVKELAYLSTNGKIVALHRFLRSSQNDVQSIVGAITTLGNSTTVANLVKDLVVEYIELVKCLKKSTGKPLTDVDVVKLIEKINELTFSSTILIRGLKPS